MLTAHGFEASRGCQHAGGPESPDVRCPDLEIHFEVKRAERIRLEPALQQARNDCPPDKLPAVAHRRNRQPWLVTLELESLLELLKRR